MGGLAKGLAIVEGVFCSSRHGASPKQREAAGATRASARRCLITLTSYGYVEHSGREFRPLTLSSQAGRGCFETRSTRRNWRSHFFRARDELAESVSLAVLDDDGAPVHRARGSRAYVSLEPSVCQYRPRVRPQHFATKRLRFSAEIGRKATGDRRDSGTLTTGRRVDRQYARLSARAMNSAPSSSSTRAKPTPPTRRAREKENGCASCAS